MPTIKTFKKNSSAHVFITVFVFIAVALFLAIVAFTIINNLLSGLPEKLTPSVGMIQQTGANYILITSVQNGPVLNNTSHAQVINVSSGKTEGNATIYAGLNNEINVMDRIIVTNTTSGVQYKVSIISDGKTVGNCKFSLK